MFLFKKELNKQKIELQFSQILVQAGVSRLAWLKRVPGFETVEPV